MSNIWVIRVPEGEERENGTENMYTSIFKSLWEEISLVAQWLRTHLLDFPGGAVDKNPSANAGDTGLNPGPGRSYISRSN